jgi:hypothetical protein
MTGARAHRSLVYVPTNRIARRAVDHGVRETAALPHCDTFVLVEHDRQAGRTRANAAAVEAARRRHPEVRTLHLTVPAWEAFLTGVLDRLGWDPPDRARMFRLHAPGGVAYGVGPNKAALVAAALDVDLLHRRDCDQAPPTHAGQVAWPGVLERAAAGRPYREVATSPLWRGAAPATEVADLPVHFCGSSLSGDPALDLADLLAVDPGLAGRVHALADPAADPADTTRRLVGKYVDNVEEPYLADHLSADRTGLTEAGVSCVYRAFRWLPDLVLEGTIGTDYTVKNLLYQLDWPVVFHSRKMVHEYDADRRHTPAHAASYAGRYLRYLLMRRIRTSLNRRIRERPHRYLRPDGTIDAGVYAGDYLHHLDAHRAELPQVARTFVDVHATAADRAEGEVAVRLRAVHAAAIRSADDAVAAVGAGLADFHWLCVRWPQVVAAATDTPVRQGWEAGA